MTHSRSLRVAIAVGVIVPLAFSWFAFAPPAFAQADACRTGTRTELVSEGGVTVEKKVSILVANENSDCYKRTKGIGGRPMPWFIRDANCKCCGSCTLDDFVALGVEVSKFIFGIVGTLALLMFVYGGFVWLTSSGSPDKVKKGQDTMVHATIGVLIVFSAWVFVNAILAAVTGQTGAGAASVFSGRWATVWSTREAPEPEL